MMRSRNARRFALLLLAALVITTIVLGLVTGITKAAAPVPEGLTSEVNHVALTTGNNLIAVAVAASVRNNGTGTSPEFAIPIPAEAANFEAMAGGVRQDGSRVIVSAGAIPAGKAVEVGFRYTVPATIASIPFVNIPASPALMVLVDEATLSLLPDEAVQSDMGVVALGQHAYHQYTLKQMEPGATIALKVKLGGNPANAQKALAEAKSTSGAPATPAGADDGKLLNRTFHGGNANVMLWQRMTGSTGHGGLVGILLIGLLAVGLVGLALVLINRRRFAAEAEMAPAAAGAAIPDDEVEPARPEPAHTAEIARLRERKTALVRRISDLDRKAVDAPSEELEELRALLKQQLVGIIKRLRQLNAHAE